METISVALATRDMEGYEHVMSTRRRRVKSKVFCDRTMLDHVLYHVATSKSMQELVRGHRH